jgi:hypothetical protein
MRPQHRAPPLPRPERPPPDPAAELRGLLDFIELGLMRLKERGELPANDAQQLADGRSLIPSSRELAETMSAMIDELRHAIAQGEDAETLLTALTLGESLMHLRSRRAGHV